MSTLRGTPIRMIERAVRRALPAAVGAVLFAGFGGGVAQAKTYTVTYDFGNPRVGNAAWRPDNDPPRDTDAGPWYGSTFTPGAGLRIAPTGNNGADYGNTRGSWWFYAPPGSTIKRARVEGLNGRANERQIGRAWLANLAPDDPAPRPANVSREIREAGTSPTTWNDASFTLAPRAGQTAGGFGLWLYTSPCGGLEGAMCAPVDPSRGAFVSLRKLTTTIDDPSKAVVNVAGLGEGTVWTNSRDVDLRVEATDPQSGIASIKADVRSAEGERQIGLGQWEPDTLHATPRAFATPPLGESRTAGQHVTAGSSGRTTVTVRVTNGAGSTTTERGAIRVDREKPTVRWPGAVKPGSVVVFSDRVSGVSSARLMIGDRSVNADCPPAATRCSVRVPDDVPSRAVVRAQLRDMAGNERGGARRAARTTAGSRPGSPEVAAAPVLAGELDLDLSTVPASQSVWYGIYAKPDHADGASLDAAGTLPLAQGSVRGGGLRAVQPDTTDARALSYLAERDGVLNVTVITATGGRLTARPAVWFLRPRDGATTSSARVVGRPAVPRTRVSSLQAGDRATGQAPRSRPLPSAPSVDGARVPRAWLRPRVRVNMSEAFAEAKPPTAGVSAGPVGGSGLVQDDTFEPIDPTEPLQGTGSPLSGSRISDPGPGWERKTRDYFIGKFGDEAAPGPGQTGFCNSGSLGRGKGVWRQREEKTIWFPLRGVQLVKGVTYSVTSTTGKLTGGAGAISADGKVKAFDIGGAVTVRREKKSTFSMDAKIVGEQGRFLVQMPVVYHTYLWRIGCRFDSSTKKYQDNYEFRESVPVRVGDQLKQAPQKLDFITCDKEPAGESSELEAPKGESSYGVARSEEVARVKDVSASIKLLGVGVSLNLSTGKSTTLSEEARISGGKKFKVCTWSKYKRDPDDNTPAWKANPDGTWLWNR